MNRFIKSNKRWLSLLGLAVIIVLLAFISRPTPIHYQMNANESLKLVNSKSISIDIQKLNGKQLIDIRSAELFAQGHPETAISIPIRQLLDDESIDMFNLLLKNGQETVLYGSDELQSTAPVLLLQQLGYQNIKFMEGGYSSDDKFMEPTLLSTESMLMDTAAIRSKPVSKEVSSVKSENKKSEAVIPIRKKESSGGGC